MKACFELRTLLRHLPECFYSEHPVVEIKRAYAFGYANPLWGRKEAMRLLFSANMEMGAAQGKGMRAAKRGARAVQAAEGRAHAFNRQMALKRKQWRQDEGVEGVQEARSHAHLLRVNIHD